MLNIGVIGVGEIGKMHIEKITSRISNARIIRINDTNESYAISVAKKYGAEIEKDPHALIAANDVDAVIITCWDQYHEEFTLAAINEKKPVFCEKPLSNTADACMRIMNAEMESGKRVLTVGFMRRFDKSYISLKETIESGEIGEPLLIHAQHRNVAPLGDLRFTTEMSISNSLAHEFDVTRWLINEEYESIQFIEPKRTRNVNYDYSDPQMAILRTKSGVHIDFEVFLNARYGYDIQCEVVGEEGTARLQDSNRSVTLRRNGLCSQSVYSNWKERFEEAYDNELRQWVDGVLAGEAIGPNAWDGYVAASVAESCIKSRLERRTVKLDYINCPKFYEKSKK
ncbi:MAG TPA: Gfo/Idh/MocA family oxidoreductase [Anaerovoracaceae bacterium]|nr:Gfo/Idh/MocA family oxidoreductase [Anaerovoracaceae bacterium]